MRAPLDPPLLALAIACSGLSLACADSGTGDDKNGGESESSSTDTASDSTEGEGEIPGDSLIDHAAWQALPLSEDPLPGHQPEEIVCSIAGWYVENERTEIDTNFCTYLALRQPLLADVAVGDPLILELFYFDLVAPDPAQAHLAVLIDGAPLWETVIDIPLDDDGSGASAPADFLTLPFDSPLAASAGADLVLHLHNHGQNTWTFAGLRHAP